MIKKSTYGDLELKIDELEKENASLKLELSERKLIAETLHDSEQQLYALVTCVPGAVYRFRIDAEWTLEFVSDEISSITGFPASTFMYKNAQNFRSIIHPDDRKGVENTIQKGIKEIEPFTKEYRIIHANKQLRWCSEKGRAVFSSDGDPLWLDGTIFDITDRKSAEEALQKANQELLRLASVDSLTQIANRRYFVECLDKEWKRMTREQAVLSLIMCDIDFFKLYNDNYGHQAGDKCLVAAANAIRSALQRPADIVARFGGEEFVIILPDTDSKGAAHIAEKIKAEIHRLQIIHEYSTVGQYLSLSVGVASVIPNQDNVSDLLLKAADDALYEAKRQGRNRVSVNTSLLK